MKPIYLLFALLLALLGVRSASAQITIDEVDPQKDAVQFRDRLKSIPVDVDYFSLARYKAERAAVRLKRNYLEVSGGVKGSLTAYNDPWIKVSGGDNSIALTASLFLRHIFTKNIFTIETVFDARFGYNRIKVETTNTDADGNKYTESNGIWFKNQDEFAVSIAPSFKMTKNWSYGAIFKFRSQFVNGYRSRTEQKEEHLKSKFLTPGYLDVSLGITYKSPKPKFPIVINLSPIALSGTFVESDVIRKNGFLYGLEDPTKTSKYEGGSSIQIDFDRKFGKSEFLRYRTSIFSFYGWITDMGQKNKISNYSEYRKAFDEWNAGEKKIEDKPRLPIHPTVRWENTIEIRATKFLATTFNFQLYYNRAQNVDVQTLMLLSVGLTYTFKNKEKP